jgi:hypothetical protein
MSRTVTVPARAKLILVENGTAGGFILNIKTPSGTAIALNLGDRKLFYNNGTTLLVVAEFSSLGGLPYDIGGTICWATDGWRDLVTLSGPTRCSIRIWYGQQSRCRRNGSGSQPTFSLRKNGTQFATMQFSSGASTATFTAASDTDFAAGDVLTVIAPNPADSTLADIGFALAGVRL